MPLYIQVKEALEEDIKTGQLRIGDKLPAEIILAKRFQVSRETVRSAIRLLEEEGKVHVRHGAGTFLVNPIPRTPSSLENLMSVTSMIKYAGLEDGERREKLRVEAPILEWSSLLEMDDGQEVIVHERVRTANGEPVAFSKNILPRQLVGEAIIEQGSIGSLFKYLKEQCNIDIYRATSEIVVPLHTDPHSQKLLIHPETTVLLLKQLHYDRKNQPVLYSFDYFRNDVFKFSINRAKIDG
ncbi:GntR family transcriptional regulator [Radiobacillus kanasensis]|uniref:GntR family transcriptional regulator n=1 Tax=Radiobacillus kanasensis TaxID=2844358 RepID=UPI001E3C61C3|nr:GntR family transcriptional regulator [Radiobacillus kanasensis]UFT99048.1 GntR family transcriptional regulator [Radiobacillus kanasensis]